MRIVIDMQGAQTESRFRGIGRYTMAFAHAVARHRGPHEVILALNGLLADSIAPLRAAFAGVLPPENIRVWHAAGPVAEHVSDHHPRRITAELVREAFLASLQPDVIHLCSLFEGYIDDAVTSIGLLDRQTPISVTLHDLIPLLNPAHYLDPHPRYAQYYRGKVAHLERAACYLAVSESSRNEGLAHLPQHPPERFFNTLEAAEPHFAPLSIDAASAQRVLEPLGITRPFLLYTGGADERKNLPRLIQAYAALPLDVRQTHQLLLAGKMPEPEVRQLQQVARSAGLQASDVRWSGYIDDTTLVQLYNLCRLYVFPSWHEGFGLPVLEAMSCGAAVLGANTSSVPEVIGWADALFDPLDIPSMTRLIARALQEAPFLAQLRAHGLQQAQKFSWDATAQRAIAAWESLPARAAPGYLARTCAPRQWLAQLAPTVRNLAPEALQTLSAHIARNQQAGLERQLFLDISELCQHDAATGVQRVVRSHLYWLLHSPPAGFRVEPVYAVPEPLGYRYARRYTQSYLQRFLPSALGDAGGNMGNGGDFVQDTPIEWQRGDVFFGLDMQHHVQLAHQGFYQQLRREGVVVKFLVHDLLPIEFPTLFQDENAARLHAQWLGMIAATDGAICVSQATADALTEWRRHHAIATSAGFQTACVHNGADLEGSAPSEGVPPEAHAQLDLLRSKPCFLCVATLEPRKAQEHLLDAMQQLWARGVDAHLVLVGQQGWGVQALLERIAQHPERDQRLHWLQGISDSYLAQVYEASTCLVAASLNEGFGLPLIEAARHRLPVLARDIAVFREIAGDGAFYFRSHSAEALAQALQDWLALYHKGQHPRPEAIRWLTWQQSAAQLQHALLGTHCPRRQLLVDISELAVRDAKSGIQRVVRSILQEWLLHPPQGYRVEPVYARAGHPYRYARTFVARFLGPTSAASADPDVVDDPIDFAPGDVFLGLDLAPGVVPWHAAFYRYLQDCGVQVQFVVYDLQPLKLDYFERVHCDAFLQWLHTVVRADALLCISHAVLQEVQDWLAQAQLPPPAPAPRLAYFHLGANIDQSQPSRGLPPDSASVLQRLSQRPTFLMVSTLAPHKGHAQVLDAFELLWAQGGPDSEVHLVIVGHIGWKVQALVERLRAHPQRGTALFWLEGISDEYLQRIYATSTCLLCASYCEGFGLPLIEAAQQGLPILARDLPVFQEVGGPHAQYFHTDHDQDSAALAQALREWLALYRQGRHPRSQGLPWLTWQASAAQLAAAAQLTPPPAPPGVSPKKV